MQGGTLVWAEATRFLPATFRRFRVAKGMDTLLADSSPDPDPLIFSPDRRFRAVAAILARGVRRTLDSPVPDPPLSAGRSSKNPSNCSETALASTAGTSVTVHTG
jgi:hypothetical protein